MERVDFQGKTDPIILSESLNSMGFDAKDIEEKTDYLKELYFTHLAQDMETHSPRILPGIKKILSQLHDKKSIILGLLTGNFARSAHIKLEPFSLNKYFPIGVFGDDAPTRNELPPIARQKINDTYNISLEYHNMTIVGDTIYDIACAKAVGARSIAVGTGWTDRDKLKMHNPDLYFDDLDDTETILEAILS